MPLSDVLLALLFGTAGLVFSFLFAQLIAVHIIVPMFKDK